MSLPSPTAYRRQVLLLMGIYTALMLLEWPFVRAAGTGPVLHVVLALGGDMLIFVFPALIVTYELVRWPIARRYGTEVLE